MPQVRRRLDYAGANVARTTFYAFAAEDLPFTKYVFKGEQAAPLDPTADKNTLAVLQYDVNGREFEGIQYFEHKGQPLAVEVSYKYSSYALDPRPVRARYSTPSYTAECTDLAHTGGGPVQGSDQ